MKVIEGILYFLGGELSMIGFLIMFPKILEFMLNIPYWTLAFPLGIILFIISILLFQWSVSISQK